MMLQSASRDGKELVYGLSLMKHSKEEEEEEEDEEEVTVSPCSLQTHLFHVQDSQLFS